jgi:hypothetical protein
MIIVAASRSVDLTAAPKEREPGEPISEEESTA